MTLSEEIATVAYSTSFSDIPENTVRRAKLFLIDTLGIALAGRNAEGVAGLAEMVLEMGGRKEATILYSGGKVPAPLASLTNALMAHARDFDDLHEAGGAHVNVSVIPAALAAAQKRGGVSGERLLTAIILGVDLVCRLGLNILIYEGWHVTTTYGVFGSTLAAGMLLGLTPEGLANALGIAYSQAAGTRQGRLEGTLAKRLQPALACQAGVTAALLAEKGLTGPRQWIEGEWGLARVYGDNHDPLDPESMTKFKKELGSVFLGDQLSFKQYPCCKVAHTAIEATLELAAEKQIHAEEVSGVSVRVSSGAYGTVGRPFRIGKNPQVDAQFSIPYTVALALTEKKVGLFGFEMKTIRNPEILDLAKRVLVEPDPEMKDTSPNMVNLAAKVEIHTRRGDFSKTLSRCKGHPDKPISPEEVFQKFRDCAKYGGILSQSDIEQTLERLNRLEALSDVGDIFESIRWRN